MQPPTGNPGSVNGKYTSENNFAKANSDTEINPFLKKRRTINDMKRPFVFINVAMTADGKIDTVARQGAAISSPRDKERVDRLRAESDAIMVGGKTLLTE